MTTHTAMGRNVSAWGRRLCGACALGASLSAPFARAVAYYVNDASTNSDLFCTAPGSDSNTGTNPAMPVASLQVLLDRYTLTASDTVHVDVGMYLLESNTVIEARHGGEWANRLTIQGAGRATVLNRQSRVKGACCLENRANYVRIQNLAFTGADIGLVIDSSSCSYADILDNAFFDNGAAAIQVQPGTNVYAYGWFTLARNLLYGNRDGMLLEPGTATMGGTFTVLNNTILVTNGTAIQMGGNIWGSQVVNNIVVAEGSGTCFEVTASYGLFQSDYNDLWAHGGGIVGRVKVGGKSVPLPLLADWQCFSQTNYAGVRDTHSFSRDPAFADPASADFHLKSFGGRWQPIPGHADGGTWFSDLDMHSPCVDTGDPWTFAEDLASEPAPNGGRKNLGADGGTPRASLAAPGRVLLAMAPDLGQDPQQAQPILWQVSGLGWEPNATVHLDYSLDGGAGWLPVAGAAWLSAANSAFDWYRPAAAFGAPSGCWVRVVSDAVTSCTDRVFLPHRAESKPAQFFVNDSNLAGDLWCRTAGYDGNDGLSSNTPMATIQAVINRYHPGIGATIHVDTGLYPLSAELLLPDTGAGGGGPSNNWFRLVGAGPGTILNRQSSAATSACIRVQQDFTRIEGLVCRGAGMGIVIDPATCRNASLVGNTLTANAGYGIVVLPDLQNQGFDTYEVRNNLVHGNGGGINLQVGSGYHLASFSVVNNTIVTYNGTGIACGGRAHGTTLMNNIVSVKGSAAVCVSVDVAGALGNSDYNDLHAYNSAGLVRWSTNNAVFVAGTLAEWQGWSGLDAHSMSRDPLFVSTVTGGGDYHERSAGGSWHGGSWTADTLTSPCVDAGNPASAYGLEPADNGGRINMGAYGGTREASKSTSGRALGLLTPGGGETVSGALTIAWRASGNGWLGADTVRIEYAAPGSGWTPLSGATSLPTSGTFVWTVPNPVSATASFHVRVVCNQDATVFDGTTLAIIITRQNACYYVNDAATNNDRYCLAPGASANAGDAPGRPLASLADVLARYRLNPGDTVYVDTGTYVLTSNLVVGASHKGTPDAPVRIVGAREGSRFVRMGAGGGRRCLEIQGDYVRVEGLTCVGADTGIAVDASAARHVQLIGNTCVSNVDFGIEIKPYGALSGEAYQILQNVVVNNGAGLFLQGGTNMFESRSLFVVENNTLYNGGFGIKLLNANSAGRRTNLLKNNLIETTNAQAACIVALPYSLHYSDFNNLRARAGGYVGAWTTGTTSQNGFTSLTHWRSVSGQDAHSLSLDGQFVNAAAGNCRLQPASPCVDAGVISYWMFDAADADGNPRVAGQTADMGAYELNVRTSVRLFMQGPFLSGTDQMTAALAPSGALSARSPYADDSRTATNVPGGVTDWVLVQFRLSTNGPAVFSRSAFLRHDGWLVNDQGVPDLDVDLLPGSAYYVVVKHRNHLAAMSSVPVAFSNQTLRYDFTRTPAAFFGGSNGCVAVTGATGTCWALRAGDADGDGAVLLIDQAIWASQTNAAGYRRGDADLNGVVAFSDSDLVAGNLAAASPVPQPETMLLPALRIAPSRSTLVGGESRALAAHGSSEAASSPASWGFVQNGSAALLAPVAGTDQARYTAGVVTGRTDVVEAWDGGDRLGRAYLNVVGTQTVAAVGRTLVIAGRKSADDTLWPTTDYLADNAYTTLRYRGFSREDILYLSPEPDQDVDGNGNLDDIDGEATFAQASDAFTNGVAHAANLFVYLVDHGGNSSGNGYFRLSATETLSAAQLDAWLDALQDAYNTQVTVLLDFCYAGSFLRELTYAGTNAQRIVIAACGTNQPSYFVAGGLVSFSGAFFSGTMLGYDVRQSFAMAQGAMASYQTALLDDDKDGAATSSDGARAAGTYIGPTFIASGDAPVIGEVCGNQVLSSETLASFWIGSVSSLHPITRAWCLIVPPGHDPDPDDPVTDLPELALVYDAASGRYAATYDGFTAPGTYNVTFYVQDEEGNVSVPRSSYIAQIGYDDRVILVVAGDTNSPAWPAIDYLSQLAYATFRLRLYTPDHICVLSPVADRDLDHDGSNDVTAVSSRASLQASLSAWASTNSTDRLTLYVIGEGLQDSLRINAAECLSTNELAAWVHGFQMTNPVPVNVVLDFSGAGAFLPALADPQLAVDYPEATRIAVASAHAGCEALFANGGTVSFTQYLLAGVISGETLGDAYTAARRAIRRVSGSVRQRAQMDDTLNGVASEKDIDGLLAAGTYLGSAFVTGADEPVIGTVMPVTVQTVTGTPITVWAADVAAMGAISNVWCVITPPGFDATGDLPALALAWNASANRYEAACADFVQPGSYTLTFFVQDAIGGVSAPVQSEIILADRYEPDNAAAQASRYDGAPQQHTLHTTVDEDWVRVFLVTNFVYDIETYHTSAHLDTVLDLYRELADGSLDWLDHVDEEGSDEGEYTGLDYPPSGWYWARITPYADGTNSVGSYEFSVDIPAAAGLNTLIVLGINDIYASALPTGSTVSVTGQGTRSFNGSTSVVFTGLTNGTYLVTVPTPTNFFPREDPWTPHQVQSLTNLSYANPRSVPVSGGWRMAGFEMLSAMAVTSGVVRDAWTHAFLGNAQIAFTAASGSLTGTVVDGSVILTTYRTNWLSAANGRLPATIVLGSCNWHLSVSLPGYQTCLRDHAVSNVQAGAQVDLGASYLVPTDANANQVADAWEGAYFPGGMVATEDSDRDGVDNRSEYLCGTDPTNALSVLRFLDAVVEPAAARMTWLSAAGRSYQVLAVTSLVDSISIATNGPWEAAYGQETMQWSDTNTPLHRTRFYRVRLN